MKQSASEAIRCALVIAASTFAISPYFTRGFVGAGDAQHYAQQLADSLEQERAGVFPILVGQSQYAFNGDFHPLRTAPYFQYVGSAVNFVTAGLLGPAGVQNALIVGSLLAASLLVYVLGKRMAGPDHAWPAALLAIAFATSPGILALIYSGDMVASWMTLPYLPLVVYGLWNSQRDADPSQALLLTFGAYAAIWLAHAPIAIWLAPLVGLCLARRMLAEKLPFTRLAAGAAFVGGLLCLYVFVSVASLQLPADPNLVAAIKNGAVVASLKSGWANTFKTVDPDGSNLIFNLQLSPVLWLAALAGVAFTERRLRNPFIIYAGLLLLLLLPIGLTAAIWDRLPDAIVGATEKWPMQRFYPILSALVPFVALPLFGHRLFVKPVVRNASVAILAIGCVFSLVETWKFVRRGGRVSQGLAATERLLRPENAVLPRYSHEYYGRLPRYYADSPDSALLQTRLLATGTLELVAGNRAAALSQAGQPGAGVTVRRFEPDGRLDSPLRVEPGKSYVVIFDFGPGASTGVLELKGRSIFRQYTFASTNEELAYRDTAGGPRAFALWTSGTDADDVEVRFHRATGGGLPGPSAELRMIAVDQAQLPIRIDGLIPFAATVSAKAKSWLETPRIFQAGFSATVDGAPEQVERSPDGLAMIPVDSGTHRVVLSYSGSGWLRASFWISAVSWIALGAVSLPVRRIRSWWDAKRRVILGALGYAGIAAVGIGCVTLVYARVGDDSGRELTPGVESEKLVLNVTFPIGRLGTRESIQSASTRDGELVLVVEYVDGKNVVFEIDRAGAPLFVSDKIPVNYVLPHTVEVSWLSPGYTVVIDHRVAIEGTRSPGQGSRGVGPKSPPARFSGSVHPVSPK